MNDDLVAITLIGVPLDLGAEALGVDMGPDALRQKQLVGKLTHTGITVHDVGDIPCAKRDGLEVGVRRMPYAREIVHVNELLAARTEQAM